MWYYLSISRQRKIILKSNKGETMKQRTTRELELNYLRTMATMAKTTRNTYYLRQCKNLLNDFKTRENTYSTIELFELYSMGYSLQDIAKMTKIDDLKLLSELLDLGSQSYLDLKFR